MFFKEAVRIVLLLAVLGLIGTGCGDEDSKGGGAPESGSRKVRVALEPAANAPIFIGRAQELFSKRGLEVEFIRFDSGPAIFPALRSKSVDVADFSTIAMAVAKSQGIDVKVFDVIYDLSTTNQLLVPPDADFKAVEDLRGKKVGAVKGSSAYYGLERALAKNGLTLDDIEYVELDPTSILPAFNKGDVDAVYAYAPQSSTLVGRGARPLISNADTGAGGSEVWVARSEWLRENPEAAKLLVQAHGDALQFMNTPEGKKLVPEVLVENMGVTNSVAQSLASEVPFPTLEQMASADSPYSLVNDRGGIAKQVSDTAGFLQRGGFIKQASVEGAVDSGPIKAATAP